MRVEHGAPAGRTEGSALECDEESHPAGSWGAALQDFKDLLYVFLFFLSLLQWFDTAPSRTCPQCRNQVKSSPPCAHLWRGALQWHQGAVAWGDARERLMVERRGAFCHLGLPRGWEDELLSTALLVAVG